MFNAVRKANTVAFLVGVLIFLLVASVSCAPSPTQKGETKASPKASQAVKITDDLGRKVVIEKVPERIVSLAPSNTEILFALGLGEKVVGVTKFCDYPPEAKQKTKIGGFSTPDLEKIVGLNPDLILATSMHEKEVIPALEDKGFTVLGVNPRNLSEVLDSIQMVGKVTGTKERASALVKDMKKRIEAITTKTKELEEKPSVFYISWHDPLWTAGSGTFTHDLIVKAGGENIFSDITGYKTVDPEKVVGRNPEVIIASTGHGGAKDKPFEWAKTAEIFKDTAARRNGRVYQVNADLVSRPGPRIVKGLEWFAYFIHPDVFSAPGR